MKGQQREPRLNDPRAPPLLAVVINYGRQWLEPQCQYGTPLGAHTCGALAETRDTSFNTQEPPGGNGKPRRPSSIYCIYEHDP